MRTFTHIASHKHAVLVSTPGLAAQNYAALQRGAVRTSSVSAEELSIAAEKAGLELEQLAGMTWDLRTQKWVLTDDAGINYIAYFQRPGIARL